MYIVTGGAGFIGSNVVKGLNKRGINNILVVDDLTDGTKYKNLVHADIADYVSIDDFMINLANYKNITAVIHQGACSDTTNWDGQYMMKYNYDASVQMLTHFNSQAVPFIYASSAAVYGASQSFQVDRINESPLNVYGFSKVLLDNYVRKMIPHSRSQIVGLRYFNVYGPHENHKAKMASVAYHFNQQLIEQGKLKLFEGSDAYGNGEQQRDFVFVDDVVAVNLWFLENPHHSGIFNVGTGRSQTFNDVANAVLKWHGRGEIEYIPFPENLKGHYQSFTEADISGLRSIGYVDDFKSVEDGVKTYLDWLNHS